MGWTSVFRQPIQKPIKLLMMKIRTKAQFIMSCWQLLLISDLMLMTLLSASLIAKLLLGVV
jgi:hypothetical protein